MKNFVQLELTPHFLLKREAFQGRNSQQALPIRKKKRILVTLTIVVEILVVFVNRALVTVLLDALCVTDLLQDVTVDGVIKPLQLVVACLIYDDSSLWLRGC
jgi:hypothetical protein